MKWYVAQRSIFEIKKPNLYRPKNLSRQIKSVRMEFRFYHIHKMAVKWGKIHPKDLGDFKDSNAKTRLKINFLFFFGADCTWVFLDYFNLQ